jgi:hypothetical protein
MLNPRLSILNSQSLVLDIGTGAAKKTTDLHEQI